MSHSVVMDRFTGRLSPRLLGVWLVDSIECFNPSMDPAMRERSVVRWMDMRVFLPVIVSSEVGGSSPYWAQHLQKRDFMSSVFAIANRCLSPYMSVSFHSVLTSFHVGLPLLLRERWKYQSPFIQIFFDNLKNLQRTPQEQEISKFLVN